MPALHLGFLLAAATALAGSGPGLVAVVAEGLEEGAVAAGLNRDQARAMTAAHCAGSAPAPVLRAYALAAAEFGTMAWGSGEPTVPSPVAHEFVCFDRSIVRRSEEFRTYREAEFPGRGHYI